MIKDDLWPAARLIPISSASGVEAQERRAASALLAVLGAVDEFGRALLKPLGAPAGKIASFIEIPMKVDGRPVRPDGIIAVTRGDKVWGCIVEVKTADAPLEAAQVETYLDLARELEFDAVLTISNQYTTLSDDYPISVDKRKIKKAQLFHWSWAEIVTEAIVQKQHRGVKDPDQAYMLNELIRYLTDPRSGALSFDDMGSNWVKVRDGARERTLRKGDAHVEEVAHRWDALIRYLCLQLTADLGRDVSQIMGQDELVSTGELLAEVRIPNAASSLRLVANLATRQITASTMVEAPKEGTSKGRVSWLLRQLQQAPNHLKIEARVARSSSTLAASLGTLREDPHTIYPEAGHEIRQFGLSLTRDMGSKRQAGRGSFIESVLTTATEFYGAALERLSPWKAKPPKLPSRPEERVMEEVVEELGPTIQEGVEEAQEEMQEMAESPSESAQEESGDEPAAGG